MVKRQRSTFFRIPSGGYPSAEDKAVSKQHTNHQKVLDAANTLLDELGQDAEAYCCLILEEIKDADRDFWLKVVKIIRRS